MHGKAKGWVELDCNYPFFNPAESPASLHVVEWIQEGSHIPILIQFGSHAPRVHPKFEGKHLVTWSQQPIPKENVNNNNK